MKTSKLLLGLIAAGAMVFMFACKKEPGPGGKAHIHGHVEHDGIKAGGATVSIWYDKTSADGDADATTTTEGMVCMTGMGATDGNFEFENLYKGNYYVQCMIAADTCIKGTSAVPVMLMGGAAVKIDKKSGEFDADIHLE